MCDALAEPGRANLFGRRNTGRLGRCREWSTEGFSRARPTERLTRSAVHLSCDEVEIVGGVLAEVGPLREELPKQPVGVFVRASVPGAGRIAEVDLQEARSLPTACW